MQYIVRVELHEPPQDPDYGSLHAEMGVEGFERWLLFGGENEPGEQLALPDAEYAIATEEGPEAVLGRAQRAARKAHSGKFGVVVTPAAAAVWSAGLKPWVEPEEGVRGRE